MVAHESAPEAMVDQPCIAMRALQPEPAGPAQRERRIAAPVEKQERLVAAFERHLHGFGERRRDIAARRRSFAAQIDRLDRRLTLAAEALGQREAGVAPAPCVHLGLDRGRRRSQHNGNFRDMRPHHRHVAGVVAHAVLLLVGRVVLLIDDDEAEVGIGQEQRGPGARHDLDLAVGGGRPGARAHARGEAGMPFRRTHAEALRESVEELRGERDLRHEHENLAGAPNHFGNGFEIDRGLAGPGHAVDQRHRIAARRDFGAQRGGGLGLRRAQVRHGKVRTGRARDRLGRKRRGLQCPLIHKPVDHAGRDAGFLDNIALGVEQAVGEQRQDFFARRRHAQGNRPGEPHRDPRALRPELLAHAQRHAQHHAAGAERVIGDPIDEISQLRLERRDFELLGHVFEPIVEPRPRHAVAPHRAGRFARPQRHAHEIAGRKLEPRRHPIGIGLIEGDRHEDVDNLLGHGRPTIRLTKGEGKG